MEKIKEQISQYVANSAGLYGNSNLNLEYCETERCFSEGCNITNLPQIYDIIIEKSKKMDSLIKKLLDRINARIYKTNGIKQKWRDMYADLTAQDAIKIDYTVYPTNDVATDKIFGDIFEEQKIGSEPILNPAVNYFIF